MEQEWRDLCDRAQWALEDLDGAAKQRMAAHGDDLGSIGEVLSQEEIRALEDMFGAASALHETVYGTPIRS